MENGQRVVVGLNKFQVEEKEKFHILSIDPEVEKAQVEKLKKYKNSRDRQKVARHLSLIKEKAAGGHNLMPLYIDAVKDGVTVGEISNVLRELWGEYYDRNN